MSEEGRPLACHSLGRLAALYSEVFYRCNVKKRRRKNDGKKCDSATSTNALRTFMKVDVSASTPEDKLSASSKSPISEITDAPLSPVRLLHVGSRARLGCGSSHQPNPSRGPAYQRGRCDVRRSDHAEVVRRVQGLSRMWKLTTSKRRKRVRCGITGVMNRTLGSGCSDAPDEREGAFEAAKAQPAAK